MIGGYSKGSLARWLPLSALRGLAKNRCEINVMAALLNLFQARRYLLSTV